MNTYIALLRGINVGGQKKVPMAELRVLFLALGFQKVETYIQSGNVVFQILEDDIDKLESSIHQAIISHFGFDVPILIKTPEMLQQIFDGCPFSEEQTMNSYFMLLYNSPDKDLVEEISKLSNDNETFMVTGDCIYFHSAFGYGKTKFNNNFFERKLKVTATARNYKTMVKLLSLSAEID